MSEIDGLPPLRDVVRDFDLAAKKSLGQNFLFDLNLTGKIARAAGPLDGVTVVSVIAGAALYTKPFGSVVEDPPAITVTATGPADRAGATTVIFESLIRLSEVPDTPSNCTLDAALSPMPFTVTTVPPLTAPDVGDIDVMLSGLEVAPYV